jgi:hypothetical protein
MNCISFLHVSPGMHRNRFLIFEYLSLLFVKRIMNLKKQILDEHSKEQCQKIVNWVGSDKKKFNELFHLFLSGEYRVSQRSAWPLSYCVIAHPHFMEDNFEKLLGNLKKPNLHDSIKRNTVRLLQAVDIPEKHEGGVMEICFKYLESPKEAVAIKAFSLTVLEKLAKKYPAIVPEIKLIIEEYLPHQSAAFKSRAKKFHKSFSFRLRFFYDEFLLLTLLP